MFYGFSSTPFSLFHSLQVSCRAAAGDQACNGSNGMWRSHGTHLHVHGTGGHRIQPLWWTTGKKVNEVHLPKTRNEHCSNYSSSIMFEALKLSATWRPQTVFIVGCLWVRVLKKIELCNLKKTLNK